MYVCKHGIQTYLYYILLSTFLHLRICPPTSPLLLCLSFYYRRLEGETQKVKTRVLHVENGPVSGLVMAAAGRLSTQMASTSISLWLRVFFPWLHQSEGKIVVN